MKRVLSLLLLVPFLSTQVLFVTPAFARGPYDDQITSKAAMVGSYGIALTGVGDTPSDYQWQPSKADPTNVTDIPNRGEVPTNLSHLPASNVTGVMVMNIPADSAAISCDVLLFKEGLMYGGIATGVPDVRNGKVRLLASLAHNFERIGTDGIKVKEGLSVVDSRYDGQINLQVKIDYFSGIAEATGDARLAEYNPLKSSTTQSVQPVQTNVVTQGFITLIPGPGISLPSASGSTSSTTGALSTTANSMTATATTTGTVTSALKAPGTLSFSNLIETSPISVITFNGGSTFIVPNANISTDPKQTTTTTFYNNATQRSSDINNQAKQLELYLTADGARYSTTPGGALTTPTGPLSYPATQAATQ